MPLLTNFPFKKVCRYEKSRMEKGHELCPRPTDGMSSQKQSFCHTLFQGRGMSAGFVLSFKIFYEYKLYHPFEKYKSSDYFLNAAKRDSVMMEMKVEVIFQTWKW